MNSFEQRNDYFNRLFATPDLRWLGQNTNHLPMHAAVRKALVDSIEAEEFHALCAAGRLYQLAAGHCCRSWPAAGDPVRARYRRCRRRARDRMPRLTVSAASIL
jgi:hypothetical protein